MQNKITFGVIGLLLGIVLTWAVASTAVNNQNAGMMRVMGMRNMMSSNNNMDDHHDDEDLMMDIDSAMRGMMEGLEGKTGDEFDKAFAAGMIAHHEGAVNMATEALQSARHQEIKDMSKASSMRRAGKITRLKAWEQA